MEQRAVNWQDHRLALQETYNAQRKGYQRILEEITRGLQGLVGGCTIKGRVKSFESFYRKLMVRSRTTTIADPFAYITDLIGLRIVTPFVGDMDIMEARIKREFRVVEVEYKSRGLSLREFGYDSTHMLIVVPDDILSACGQPQRIVEIQLRTILQDAWAEVEHELVYKASINRVDQKVCRKLTALNATLSLADTIFQELRDCQGQRPSARDDHASGPLTALPLTALPEADTIRLQGQFKRLLRGNEGRLLHMDHQAASRVLLRELLEQLFQARLLVANLPFLFLVAAKKVMTLLQKPS